MVLGWVWLGDVWLQAVCPTQRIDAEGFALGEWYRRL